MKRIGILSDTHAWWDDKYEKYFSNCDEIWHAGDFGSDEIADKLAAIAPLRAVYGNVDGASLRQRFKETLLFETEGVKVLMTHIGGYPGKYAPGIKSLLMFKKPTIFVTGHSHILKVMNDRQLNILHINPGAAGRQGWQTVSTLILLTLDAGHITACEVVELSR
ncbi:MAG: metallophosphoesterase family protein [Muribaculaceae bacterium]